MTSARESAWDHNTAPISREHGVDEQSLASLHGVRKVETRDGLAAINEPGTELAIWQRSLPAPLRDWLEHLDIATLPYLRILVQPRDLRHALEPLLDECGMTAGDMRDLLLNDVDRLVWAFAAITGSDCVDVRLERVDHDACWKFHRDTVEARLVTTYRGPTTQWVRMAQAEQAIAEQREYQGPLECLGDHDVALFKGNCAGPDSGVVHRSPPIAGTGLSRLFLCLNKQTEVSPDPWPTA